MRSSCRQPRRPGDRLRPTNSEETCHDRNHEPVAARRCARGQDGGGARLHRRQISPAHAGRSRHEPAAQRRRHDQGQSQSSRPDGRRSAAAGDAREADADRFFQASLRPVDASPAKRPACGEGRPAREDGARRPAARHCRRRLHPRRSWLLGRPAGRAYVDEEATWAIRAHQALRFYADESVGYEIRNRTSRCSAPTIAPIPMSRKTTSACGTTSGTCRAA